MSLRLASLSRALVVASVVVASIACNEPKIANRCAGTEEPHCITRVVCSYDQKRGCEACACDSPFPASSVAPETPPVR